MSARRRRRANSVSHDRRRERFVRSATDTPPCSPSPSSLIRPRRRRRLLARIACARACARAVALDRSSQQLSTQVSVGKRSVLSGQAQQAQFASAASSAGAHLAVVRVYCDAAAM